MTLKSIKPKNQKSQILKPKYTIEFKIPYFMVPHHLARLTETGIQTLMLIYFMECSQYKSGAIYPSQKTIGENCHCNWRTVERTISELKELGLIKVTPRPGKTSLIKITIVGVTYLEPLSKCQTTPVKMSGVPLSKCQTSNKELSNKELYKEPDINKKLTERENAQRLAQQEQEFFYPKREQKYQQLWTAPPLQKVADMDIELIPAEKLAGNFKKDTRTVLPGQGRCKK